MQQALLEARAVIVAKPGSLPGTATDVSCSCLDLPIAVRLLKVAILRVLSANFVRCSCAYVFVRKQRGVQREQDVPGSST